MPRALKLRTFSRFKSKHWWDLYALPRGFNESFRGTYFWCHSQRQFMYAKQRPSLKYFTKVLLILFPKINGNLRPSGARLCETLPTGGAITFFHQDCWFLTTILLHQTIIYESISIIYAIKRLFTTYKSLFAALLSPKLWSSRKLLILPMIPSILESTTILSNTFSTIQCHLLPYSDRAPNSSHQGHHEHFVTAAPRPRRDGAAPLYFKNSKSKIFCSDLCSDILAMMTHFSDYFRVYFSMYLQQPWYLANFCGTLSTCFESELQTMLPWHW